MKKICILLMAITFIGCNSDDDNSTPPTDNQASILGKWYYDNSVEIIELSATKLSYSYSTDLDETVIENFDRE